MRRIMSAVVAGMIFTAAGAAYADGAQELFEKKCAGCHGKDGKGDTKMGKEKKVTDMTSKDVQAKFTDDEATKAITDGIDDKASGKKRMPAFKDKVGAEDVGALVKYVRAFAK